MDPQNDDNMAEPATATDKLGGVPLDGPEIATLWQLLEATPCSGIGFVRRVARIADKLEAYNETLPEGSRAPLRQKQKMQAPGKAGVNPKPS